MFADVRYSKDITKPLRYNEEKLEQRKAECILAENFLKDADQLSHKDKLNYFRMQTSLNTRTEANTIHISLNFSPKDKFSNERMTDLSKEYMDKIGLGEQPYLVYRHYDSSHPHVHVVSTNIRPDGRRIDMLDIILHRSQKVANEIAETHALRRVGQKEYKDLGKDEKIHAQKILPGESMIQPGISAVLDKVIDHYRYSSLPELNAILKLYNIRAERGAEGSNMYRHGGLFYGVIDENGKRMGKGIKASAFDRKPTLKNLQARFAANADHLKQQDQRVRTTIDWTLAGNSYDLAGFREELEKERISVVPELDKKGTLQNIYYIDHLTQRVFDGKIIGGQYSAGGIMERCLGKVPEQEQTEQLVHRHSLNHH